MFDTRLSRRRFLWCSAAGAAMSLAWPDSARALGSFDSLFAPDAELWPRWQAHDPDSRRTVDHTPWGAFIAAHLDAGADGINRLDYARAKAGRGKLDRYADMLAGVPVDGLNRAEQRAYWINLYNALTVQVVLDHYPVNTIRDIDISPGLIADGPWDKPLVEVEGEGVTLNDIEHRILRPIWQDNRIHYAVNCASVGCPNLQPEPFTAANTAMLLEAGAREYVNHPRGARLDADGDLIVSKIYDWFIEDFGDSDAGVLEHLRRYAGPVLAEAIAGRGRIDGTAYDWTLNDTALAAR